MTAPDMRMESDSFGPIEVPAFGLVTLRAEP